MTNTDKKSKLILIEDSKYEFRNIIKEMKYDDYNAQKFKSIIVKLEKFSFNNRKVNETRELIIEVINNIDTIKEPMEKEWNNIKEDILKRKSIIQENKDNNSTDLSTIVIRIWNGLLTMQYYIEEKTMPKNVN